MKETTPAAMPPCFDRWCQRFDNIFGHIAQKREFRNYRDLNKFGSTEPSM
jgi:hypothetical protein